MSNICIQCVSAHKPRKLVVTLIILGLVCTVSACARPFKMGVSAPEQLHMWQQTPGFLINVDLLKLDQFGRLPDALQIEEFLSQIERLTGPSFNTDDVEGLRIEIEQRRRWVTASFENTFDGQQWIIQGQLISPDSVRPRGDLEFQPRIIRRLSSSSRNRQISEEGIVRAYAAFQSALSDLARQAAEDSELQEFAPTEGGTAGA